ncbi:MAG: diheme cytochrome c-553 [Haliscomenobacter sp.]|nr:c-type cytochrome [Haliscomenobacter sp.]MBK9488292.1 diheme cytochrome c-553 [Haliscomenobacter sp.]
MRPYAIVLMLFVSLVALLWCTPDVKNDLVEIKVPSQAELVKRGAYLVTIGVCDDCHSPKIFGPNGPEVDSTRRLSGHPREEPIPKITDPGMVKPGEWVLFGPMFTATAGEWGVSFSANLTPDDTGIGNWDFKQFEKAIREGKSKGMDGTRPLLPPMPWFNFAQMSDEDLQAIFAYLKSLPPVNNAVPNPIPPTKMFSE